MSLPKWSPALEQRILDGLAAGETQIDISAACGLDARGQTVSNWINAGRRGHARYAAIARAAEQARALRLTPKPLQVAPVAETAGTVGAPAPLRLVTADEAALKRASIAARGAPPALAPPAPLPAASPRALQARAKRAAAKAEAPAPEPKPKREWDRRGVYPREALRRALEWATMAAAAALAGEGSCRWPDAPSFPAAKLVLQTPVDPDERGAVFLRCLLELAERAKHDAWLTDAPVVHVAGERAGRKSVDG